MPEPKCADMTISQFLLATLLFGLTLPAAAQQRCGTDEYETLRHQQNPKREQAEQFEGWIKTRLAERKATLSTHRTQATYTIPVVVHVIHNGEPIGSGTNISEAQIQSQINVLNKDFQRLNTDAGSTPSEFLPVAGSLDIEFVLAKQDPYGAPTTGILRTKGTKSSWTIVDNATFKSLSYWPAEDYFNIWVINIPSFLGYAQLPVSNLPGLEDSSDDRLTDGIIVHYTAFGSNAEGLGTFNLDPQFDKGRTATHETGHFLGLRHIWGDAFCGTDYVDDTPTQTNETTGCPTHPQSTTCTVPRVKMFQNYMDYSGDACMNIFSQGQVARMVVVLENSPRRFSLLNSDGATVPTVLTNDLAVIKIQNPTSTICGGSFTPSIQLKNIGTTTATSAQVELKVNGIVNQTQSFTLALDNLDSVFVSFNSISQTTGSVNYEFNVLTVNGVPDQQPENDLIQLTTTVPGQVSPPISESFNAFPSGWTTENPDNGKTWEYRSFTGSQKALYVNCYDYENEGAVDRLVTPILDLTAATAASLKFDRAYALYSSSNPDRLRVLVSTVCDFSGPVTEVFNKAGTALATAPQTTSPFTPTTSQWVTETISLNSFLGNKIQIAFEVVNAWGNNVYLDNVIIETDAFIDLALVALESPGPVTCVAAPNPVVRVRNSGSIDIASFTIVPRINGTNQSAQVISLSTPLLPGQERSITLNPLALAVDLNFVSFTVSAPNGLTDVKSDNNQISNRRVVNQVTDILPLRENFNDDFLAEWPVISQNNEATWIPFATNKLYSLAYNAYSNTKRGEESWIVSPVLDLSQVSEASLFFDVSYATQTNGNERLRVVYSEDCGQTYPFVLYDQSGSSLATTTSSSPWIPTQEEDWRREFINLKALTGKESIRIAFVSTADNGNNLFVDNLEFFTDDDPDPVSITDLYAIYGGGDSFNITFNLSERTPVTVAAYSVTGQVMLQQTLPETLNQTYTIDLQQQGTGIYIVKIQIGNVVGVSKVFLNGN